MEPRKSLPAGIYNNLFINKAIWAQNIPGKLSQCFESHFLRCCQVCDHKQRRVDGRHWGNLLGFYFGHLWYVAQWFAEILLRESSLAETSNLLHDLISLSLYNRGLGDVLRTAEKTLHWWKDVEGTVDVWFGTTIHEQGNLLCSKKIMHFFDESQSDQDIGDVVQSSASASARWLKSFRLWIFDQHCTGNVQADFSDILLKTKFFIVF